MAMRGKPNDQYLAPISYSIDAASDRYSRDNIDKMREARQAVVMASYGSLKCDSNAAQTSPPRVLSLHLIVKFSSAYVLSR